ncbi:MAG: amidohydrolase family protein [Synechococcaceae cyanobacterium]|nr:amidohydrolase family protein [Synechococcaceae cyanobacterium]
MTVLPPLRLPRALVDPRARDLPPADGDGLVTVVIEHQGGRIQGLRPPAAGVRDAPLALSPPVEPHAHLDKAYSARRFPNRDGTIAGALAANHREADRRTEEQVRARAERALARAWRQGLRAIRSHIDSLGPAAAPSWEVLQDLRQRWAQRLELQLVALVPVQHWATAEGERLAGRVARSGGLLGGVLGNPFPAGREAEEGLRALLRLAEHHGCGIDLHVDESDTHAGRGVRLVTRLLAGRSAPVPLTCSHAASMGLLRADPLQRLAETMGAAGLGVVALPTTNLWLLDRSAARTPSRRPVAPIRQLQEAGVAVAVGGDNVQDAWFPGGDFDPLALLRFSLAACHLAPWDRLGLAPFTTAASALLGLGWDGVLRPGAPADLLVLEASGWEDLLGGDVPRRVLRAGRWLEPAPPPG